VIPDNSDYMFKAIKQSEFNALKSMLSEYYSYLLVHSSTFINPILGLYKITMAEVEPIYFILMKSINIFHKDELPSGSRLLCFDLKGSTAGRKTSDLNPLSLMDLDAKIDTSKTFKDDDFMIGVQGLGLAMQQYETYYSSIKTDTEFFAAHNIIDYSLVMYIALIPYSSCTSSKSSKKLQGNIPNSSLIYEEQTTINGHIIFSMQEFGCYNPIVYQIKNSQDVHFFKDMFKTEIYLDPEENETPKKDCLKKTNSNQNVNLLSSSKGRAVFRKLNSEMDSYIFNFPIITKASDMQNYTMLNKPLPSPSVVESLELIEIITRRKSNLVEDETDQENEIIKPTDINSKVEERSMLSEMVKPEMMKDKSAIVQLYYDNKNGTFVKKMMCFGLIDYLSVLP